jgi:hypothetical protein
MRLGELGGTTMQIDEQAWYLEVIASGIDRRSAINRTLLSQPEVGHRNARRLRRESARINRQLLELTTNALKAGLEREQITAITYVDAAGDPWVGSAR